MEKLKKYRALHKASSGGCHGMFRSKDRAGQAQLKKTGATRRGQTTKANKFFRDTQTKEKIQINENIKFNNERARTKTIKDKRKKA